MTLRVGWIGCGRQARGMLLPHLAQAGMRLGALCDSDASALAQTAADYGVAQTTKDWRDLISLPGLDAICMAVGPHLHQQAALASLERGLPVFLEKPPAATAEGAAEIAAMSSRTGVPVFVGFMKRFSSGNKIAHNILRGPEFGPVLGITGSYMTAPTYFEGEVDYTGFYLHHCVHYFDLIPWLVGSPLADIGQRSISPKPGRLLFHLNLRCENGAIGTVVMGTVQSRGTPMEAIMVMGDHQRVEIQNVINIAWHRDPPFKADDPDAVLGREDTKIWTPNFTAAANEDHKGYAALLREVANGLRGQPNSAPTIQDGVTAMGWLERLVDMVETERRQSNS